MSYFDLILSVPLIWGAFNGFRKGLIIEVASLVALVAGIYGAMEFSFLAASFISDKFDWSERLIHWTSFMLTFILIVFLVHLIARGIQKLVKLAALGTINRVFGSIFGLAKYLLILSSVLYFVNRIDQRYPFMSEEFKENSYLYSPLSGLVTFVFPKLEKALEEEVDYSKIAFIPGSGMPSRYSISAPPPVEI